MKKDHCHPRGDSAEMYVTSVRGGEYQCLLKLGRESKVSKLHEGVTLGMGLEGVEIGALRRALGLTM
jgi:hypothetical protein